MPAGETMHPQRERTFLGDVGTGLPDLVGDCVAATREIDETLLTATYHDTEDLRLVCAGVTVSRREGCDDSGWHVKVGSGRSRIDLQRPQTRTERVPAAVRRLLHGVVRSGLLEPVAVVRTRRRQVLLLDAEGVVLAKVARGMVTATRLADAAEVEWYEIEVEWVSGDRQLLDDVATRLVGHGAVESDLPFTLRRALGDRVAPPPGGPSDKPSAGQVLGAYLAEVHSRLLRHDVGQRAGQPDAVDQMRTHAGRMRSALAAYRTRFRSGSTAPLEEGLRWLGQQLSSLRDLEVADALLAGATDPEGAHQSDGVAVRRARRELSARRRTQVSAVADLLDSDPYFRLLDGLAAFVAAPPFRGRARRPARRALHRAVRREHRRVVKRWSLARTSDDPAGWHAVQAAAERLRYGCEVAEPVLGRDAGRLRQRAKALCTVLGDRQDALLLQRTVADLLPALGTSAAARDTGFVLGRLQERQEVRVRELEERAVPAVERLQTSKASGWLS